MADLTFKPEFGYRIIPDSPPTLVTRFEDGSLSIREKSTTSKRRFLAEFTLNDADAKTLLDLFDTKNLDTTLTIITYWPQAVDPTTDEATVYFVSKPTVQAVGPALHKIRCEFREQ